MAALPAFRTVLPLAPLAGLLLAAGCADVKRIPRHEAFSAATPEARTLRESAMNERWQNRSFEELVTTLGKPRMTLNIPGGGNPPGFAAVYGIDEGTGCIDAFAVNQGREPTVRIYYCR